MLRTAGLQLLIFLAMGALAEKVFDVTLSVPKGSKVNQLAARNNDKTISDRLQLKVGAMGVQFFAGPPRNEMIQSYLYTQLQKWSKNNTQLLIFVKPQGKEAGYRLSMETKHGEAIGYVMATHARSAARTVATRCADSTIEAVSKAVVDECCDFAVEREMEPLYANKHFPVTGDAAGRDNECPAPPPSCSILGRSASIGRPPHSAQPAKPTF